MFSTTTKLVMYEYKCFPVDRSLLQKITVNERKYNMAIIFAEKITRDDYKSIL